MNFPTQPASDFLFAYGTLHPGHAPEEIADVVRRFEVIWKGIVPGRLYDLGSYPGAVLDPSSSTGIAGTIFRLPAGDDVLPRLDAYEEFDPERPRRSLFLRRLDRVNLAEACTLDCWIYEYNGPLDRARLIENGKFVVRRGRNHRGMR